MESEDGTGGRHPLLGDVDCHPPIPFVFKADNFSYLLFHFSVSTYGPFLCLVAFIIFPNDILQILHTLFRFLFYMKYCHC